jgi:hypothetical protein
MRMADHGRAPSRSVRIAWVWLIILMASALASRAQVSQLDPLGSSVVQPVSVAPASAASGSSQLNSPAVLQLPDSPGAVYAQALVQEQTPPAGQATPAAQIMPAPQTSQDQGQQQTQPPVQQPAQPTQPGSTQEPSGTAAARAANPAGVAASEPAGAAIAPAKQKRVRTILISAAAVLGAGAAIGAVAALSAGSPSRPPGAH